MKKVLLMLMLVTTMYADNAYQCNQLLIKADRMIMKAERLHTGDGKITTLSQMAIMYMERYKICMVNINKEVSVMLTSYLFLFVWFYVLGSYINFIFT